jgi:glyoxylase-like metal-dependent hydrolase (beta-lactamase superfamily II)
LELKLKAMKLTVIDTGYFKLDGGAMFGVVPKTIWEKLESPDEKNLCTWAMRCLLVQTADKNILVDCGIGNKQSEKFFSHYEPHGESSLIDSLKKVGLSTDDITDVFLTHLHFDHVGGAVSIENGNYVPTFPKAIYWSNAQHWNWAMYPNNREKASFLKENFEPLMNAGVLKFIDSTSYDSQINFCDNIDVLFTYGHTEAMMLPMITLNDQKIVYCADLLPSPSHIPLPYVMGYDVRPLQTMIEKEYFLKRAEKEQWILVFEHAKSVEACTVKTDEKGRIVVDKSGLLTDFIS